MTEKEFHLSREELQALLDESFDNGSKAAFVVLRSAIEDLESRLEELRR